MIFPDTERATNTYSPVKRRFRILFGAFGFLTKGNQKVIYLNSVFFYFWFETLGNSWKFANFFFVSILARRWYLFFWGVGNPSFNAFGRKDLFHKGFYKDLTILNSFCQKTLSTLHLPPSFGKNIPRVFWETESRGWKQTKRRLVTRRFFFFF